MASSFTSSANGSVLQASSTDHKLLAQSNMTILTWFSGFEKMCKDEFEAIQAALLANGIVVPSQVNAGQPRLEPTNAAANESLFENTKADAVATWSFGKIEAGSNTDGWIPLGVRNMPRLGSSPLAQEALPLQGMTTFSLDFLVGILGGEEWSPGLYYPATLAKAHSQQLKKMLKSKSYYVFDAEYDPFLPKKPGEHGCKLTVFFRENDTEEDDLYGNVPLFVAMPGQATDDGKKKYTYLGTYSQRRWSDKLDFDRVRDVVPAHVKNHWAEKLVDPQREEWLEHALMEQFWPMPKYEGPIPKAAETESTTVTGTHAAEDNTTALQGHKDALEDYLEELVEWQKDAKMKVGLLKKENILEAFTKEDAAEVPGLRFWWEYLQCVGFDRNFYYILSTAQKETLGETQTNTGEGGI